MMHAGAGRVVAGMLALWLVSGCGGGLGLPLLPLTTGSGAGPAAGQFEFQLGRGDPPAFTRPGGTVGRQARDVAVAGVKCLNALGTGFDAFNHGSRGLSILDGFVFVPSRAVTTEVIDEVVDGYRVTGSIQRDDADPSVPVVRIYHIVGPDLDLEATVTEEASGRRTIRAAGSARDFSNKPVSIKALDETMVAGTAEEGRWRFEAVRANGTVEISLDIDHAAGGERPAPVLAGEGIWVEGDGFWARCEFDLVEVAASAVVGSVRFEASNRFGFDLTFNEDGTLAGQIDNAGGQATASVEADPRGIVVKPPKGGEPGLGAQEQFVLDMRLRPPAPGSGVVK